MSSTIDNMLSLTAEIAEELLLLKDIETTSLPDNLKKKIIALAEMAAASSATTSTAAPTIELKEPETVAETATETTEDSSDENATSQETGSINTITADITPFPVETVEWADEETINQKTVEPENETTAFAIDPAALRRAFSINDSFFFRREIFKGSEQLFRKALNDLACCNSRNELKEYLTTELALNIEDSPGRDFYNILRPHF